MNKASLRKKYKALRASLSAEERDNRSLAIANQLLGLDIWEYDYYHIFLPIERLLEVDTTYILNILSGKDKNVLISKSDFEKGTMQHFLLLDNTKLQVNEYGIPEPVDGIEIAFAKAQVVFLPLLAYDSKGNRVGYGKGFYDKLLAESNKELLTIGLSYFEPEEKEITTNSLDVSMKYCVSPSNSFKFC
ncbi:5-formyltetrahydrofolate cyclo-ligase [Dokdonia sinensis]|uniref:5-formyltetrahydrofolate cyclo-ligase n=1 Tax=Dokdonia sinensis TaxID=2479847 RepID=A0A3M0GDK9_9FLAO|nr:5-formyltetrahydrofolate cyclo-ligase [Dokdonia sinensis]RMB63251.1 5-formyltetrahydrofolate cyclo-ligase [Dokdonia sinensis]